jgi:hypothetical protein
MKKWPKWSENALLAGFELVKFLKLDVRTYLFQQKMANHQPAGVAIGLIAISRISSLNCSWLQVFPPWKSSSIDVQNVWLYWKCSLLENVVCFCISTILQLITWVVLGTGMSVILYTPGHVLPEENL